MKVDTLAMVVAAMAISSPLAAQQRGAVELGGFINAAYFDHSLRLDQGEVGPGAVLGYFIRDRLAVEGELARVEINGAANNDLRYLPIRGRLTYNYPLGEDAALLLGGGYVHTVLRRDVGPNTDDGGATGLIGLRLGAHEPLQIRLDSYLDFLPSASNGDDNVNWGLTVGISYLFRNAPRDTDRDGVANAADRCPGTPVNTVVDTNGCSAAQRDSDRDGVNDEADRCANTPAGERVSADGCPLPKDADKDGVVDGTDTCPNTAAGAAVDAQGCSAEQRDSDHDGVNDATDRCANTPAGTAVDANGCPKPKDTDGDGVTDDQDKCPNTAAGAKVDETGCEALPEGKEALVLKGVTFESGKSELTAEAQQVLVGVAQALAARPDVRVEVQGHTDNTGSRAMNTRLSKARADAVRAFLVEHGVAADRLTAKGYGPNNPIASNDTPEGRAENRRVALERRE